jgi:2-keto-4-pentenoate hydratase
VKYDGQQQQHIEQLAEQLFAAETSRRPIEPLTDACPDLTLAAAYQVQQRNVERRLAAGAVVVGHKIGLTGKPMQNKFGVSEPDYGHLLDCMYHEAAAALDLCELIDPQIEVEPAFVLGQDLVGPGLTVADVVRATDYVVACFEIIDSRIRNWRIKLQDTVADNGSSARFVLGNRKVKPDGLVLDDMATSLDFDGKVMDSGNSRAILGHPANGIAWLGNKLAEYGVSLDAGHVVLPGTCIRSFRIARVRRATGRIAGLEDVELHFTGTPAVDSGEI